VSGFFGSGKSSFAKNLGYALENCTVLDKKFTDLFVAQVADPRLEPLLKNYIQRVPTGVILFETVKETDTRKVTQRTADSLWGKDCSHSIPG